ncbi:MAG: hypothetical protein K1X64_03910 [Myxococcaceae bacterium]|nr:hypothetical protein [Myxococcaceae bacterium]
MRKIVLLMGVVSSLVMTACGPRSCNELCEKPCSGITTSDCKASCTKAAAVTKASSCQQKYDVYVSCLSGLADADRCSSTNTLCKTEMNAFVSCAADYCTAHPNDAACKL